MVVKDIDKLKELLTGWGVPFYEEETEIILGFGNTINGIAIMVGDTEGIPDSPKVVGYIGFFTQYLFTSEGDFISMGAWE